MKKWFGFLAACLIVASAFAQSIPFKVDFKVIQDDLSPRVVLMVTVPHHHKLYADAFEVTDSDGKPLKVITAPVPKEVYDTFSETNTLVFDRNFAAEYELPDSDTVHVKLFGCSDVACFPPTTLTFSIAGAMPVKKDAVTSDENQSDPEWKTLADQFDIVRTDVGYMNVKQFLSFLDVTKSAENGFLKSPVEFFMQFGWPLTALLILLGGLALNLTPCVLPMIPVNIAIIGAGAQAGSRRRGFLLGGVYGLGIALTYGLIGLVVVMTGAKFGAVNASPWFNLGIAVVFILLGLAMFDVIMIDLSRFQSQLGAGKKTAGYTLAITMGGVVALLAGACVAPVVIAVILLSSNLYLSGAAMGLVLPFMLGLGMALPWPFVGAGLSFLPKPGPWMKVVKTVFGILIFVAAVYYGHLSYTLFRVNRAAAAQIEESHGPTLEEGLQQALDEDRMVVIDFWATWCKNCLAMKRTTLKDVAVKDVMSDFVFIPYQAEDFEAPETEAVMDYFHVRGLPTYVILKPKAQR